MHTCIHAPIKHAGLQISQILSVIKCILHGYRFKLCAPRDASILGPVIISKTTRFWRYEASLGFTILAHCSNMVELP